MKMNQKTIELFHEWNSQRIGITEEESISRMKHADSLFKDGFSGRRYKGFILNYLTVIHTLFPVVEGCMLGELLGIPRMLSQPEKPLDKDNPLMQSLLNTEGDEQLVVVDFGCGMANMSRQIVTELINKGKRAKLLLVDFKMARIDFLVWLCNKKGIPVEHIAIVDKYPPYIPKCNVIIATDVMEHLELPVEHFKTFYGALKDGGVFWTILHHYNRNEQHINPDLPKFHDMLIDMGYNCQIKRNMYVKAKKG
jgi:SAM-dependent methyltransferase